MAATPTESSPHAPREVVHHAEHDAYLRLRRRFRIAATFDGSDRHFQRAASGHEPAAVDDAVAGDALHAQRLGLPLLLVGVFEERLVIGQPKDDTRVLAT